MPSLPLVAELAEEAVTPFDTFGAFDSQGATAVDYSEDAAALFGLGHNHLHGIGGGAKEGDHFEDIFNAAENVDGEAVAEEDEKGVAGGDGLSVFDGGGLHGVVVAFDADEPIAGGLAEGDAEFHRGVRVDDGFVEILHRLDEMALAKDQIGAFGYGELNALQFHSYILDRKYAVVVVDDGDRVSGA